MVCCSAQFERVRETGTYRSLIGKSPKRRVKAQAREDRAPASGPNQVWAMDFVHDQLFDGRKIRILTVVDTFTRLSPAIEQGLRSPPRLRTPLLCKR